MDIFTICHCYLLTEETHDPSPKRSFKYTV